MKEKPTPEKAAEAGAKLAGKRVKRHAINEFYLHAKVLDVRAGNGFWEMGIELEFEGNCFEHRRVYVPFSCSLPPDRELTAGDNVFIVGQIGCRNSIGLVAKEITLDDEAGE